MILVVYAMGVAAFLLTFAFTGMARSCRKAIVLVHQTLQIILDPALDDDVKETSSRRAALQMLLQGIRIAAKGAITGFAAVLPLMLADVLGIAPWEETSRFALRWDVILITSAVMVLAWLIVRPRITRPEP